MAEDERPGAPTKALPGDKVVWAEGSGETWTTVGAAVTWTNVQPNEVS